ncbi:YIP1 family protein [Vallitalea okinawensis]|uniref:YIP1 family protein n=1 Tax=Vallitalea okinawensis TaxID=2078660 RepID=UPI000CFB140E|nr:YIP1 family protein [Vallitalea okinawensis]
MSENQQNVNEEWEREVLVEKKPVMSLGNKVVKIFTSPYEVFENLMDHPKILLPLIVVCILGLISTLASMPFSQKVAENMIAIYEQYGIPTAGADTFTGVVGIVTAPLTILVGWALFSVLYWIAARIFQVKVSINQVFSVYAHTLIVQYGISIITMALNSFVFKSGVDFFSLGVILPNMDVTSTLYYFLQYFSLPMLWSLVLTGLGLSYLGKKKAFMGVLSVFLCYSAIAYGMSFMATLAFRMFVPS